MQPSTLSRRILNDECILGPALLSLLPALHATCTLSSACSHGAYASVLASNGARDPGHPALCRVLHPLLDEATGCLPDPCRRPGHHGSGDLEYPAWTIPPPDTVQ